jgi:nitrite reductase (NO-forming)
MPATLDQPPIEDSVDTTASSAPPRQRPPRPVTIETPAPRPRGWFGHYRQHLWAGAISVLVIGIAVSPLAVDFMGRQQSSNQTAAAAPAANLPTSISITASEFKFSPTSLQVPAGQKISITLDNKGAVEHDLTIQSAGFTLLAKPGQSATKEFTFDKPGVFDFICSIPGHKDAGMQGTITAVGPGATAAQPAPQAGQAPMHDMSNMPGMTSASAPAALPMPPDLKSMPAPVVAPPVNRTEPAYVKFDLETKKVVARMADGVAYEYWTFNGTVPGPMLRVREGDTVEIDLTNAADAGVTHSIDLHAVTGPGGGATVTQVMPGETGSFVFKALTPGVYVYHCATPMVSQHIASGMYGMIVVEPKEGLPKVDHEYYLMEGDFYLQGQRGDQGLRAFDLNKMLDERPDYVLFNGSVGANTGANAFQANVGDSVRIFFGVGGPNLTSSFHVIGEIFDRVYPEGALANPETNVQTTHVPAGGVTVVEFKTEVPGTYSIVDHSLGRMEKGAAAQIVVSGDPNPDVFHAIKPGSGGAGGH